MVGVVAGRGTDDLGARQTFDQQLVGARIVGQAFLRKHAQLDVDRPFVFVDQRLHAVEAAHADAGIDLDMRAHPRRAVLDAVLQCPRARACTSSTVNVGFTSFTRFTAFAERSVSARSGR